MISSSDILELHNSPDRFDTFSSDDPDETRAFATSIYCPHEFRLAPREKSLATRIAASALHNVGLSSVGFGAHVTVDPDRLGDFFLVQSVVSGSVDVASGKQRRVCTPDIATVVSPSEATRMVWDRDARFLSVKIDREALEAQLSELIGAAVEKPVVFELGMDTSVDSAKPWHSVVRALYQHCRFADWHANDPMAGEMFERWLISTLLHSQPHNYSDRLMKRLPASAPRCVRTAAEILDRNSAESISAKRLAVAVGVSERKLRELFRRFLGKSPKQYQLDNQLRLARSRLTSAAPDKTVTHVLAECGVEHHGRFSARYKSRFGETPSTTLRDSRRARFDRGAVSQTQAGLL